MLCGRVFSEYTEKFPTKWRRRTFFLTFRFIRRLLTFEIVRRQQTDSISILKSFIFSRCFSNITNNLKWSRKFYLICLIPRRFLSRSILVTQQFRLALLNCIVS